MEPLPKVRTPISVYWREFRVQIVPIFFFAGIVAAIVLLWRETGMDSTLSGMGEGESHLVTSSQAAIIEQMLVEPFEMVEAGQPLAILRPKDTQAQLDLLRTELDLVRMRQQPSVAEGNAMNFERLRMEWWRTKSELAVARINLENAEEQVGRYEPLFEERLISEDVYDLSVTTRNALRAEVREKSAAEAALKERLEALQTIGVPGGETTNAPAQIALEEILSRIEAQTAPFVLEAPSRGMVNSIYRHPGEHVMQGEPIVIVNSLWSQRIVGYLRQPYPIDPQVGLQVEVTTRDRHRREFSSEIVKVGAQVQIITNALAFLRPGTLVDSGLPIVVALPREMQIRPGELVDIRVHPASDTAAPPSTVAGGALARWTRDWN